ncbi:MAG: hypothetical protein ACLR2E_04370 [Lachnospiraceae bacterium]
MKMITVAGAHACGKTSVILKTAELLLKENCRPGVMKLDCISSEDDRIYSAAGITNVKYISETSARTTILRIPSRISSSGA